MFASVCACLAPYKPLLCRGPRSRRLFCAHTHTAVPGSAEEKLEARLAAVETPEDDVSRLDQSILWLFRGAPLTMEEIEKETE